MSIMFDAVSLGNLILDNRLVSSAVFESGRGENAATKAQPEGQLTLSLDGRQPVGPLPVSVETAANSQAGM